MLLYVSASPFCYSYRLRRLLLGLPFVFPLLLSCLSAPLCSSRAGLPLSALYVLFYLQPGVVGFALCLRGASTVTIALRIPVHAIPLHVQHAILYVQHVQHANPRAQLHPFTRANLHNCIHSRAPTCTLALGTICLCNHAILHAVIIASCERQLAYTRTLPLLKHANLRAILFPARE